MISTTCQGSDFHPFGAIITVDTLEHEDAMARTEGWFWLEGNNCSDRVKFRRDVLVLVGGAGFQRSQTLPVLMYVRCNLLRNTCVKERDALALA